MLYDKDIRPPLFDLLEENAGFFGGRVRILEEVTTGRARADAVMVTPGLLYGIEIKSDADTYARLSRQVKDYNQFFDYNLIAVGSSHAHHIEEHVPDWWGIITIEQGEKDGKTWIDFYVLRKARENPNVDRKKTLGLLWRPELAHIQKINHMARYQEKSKKFVIDKILEKVPEKLLKEQISEELFERDYTKIEQEIREYRRQRRRL